MSHRDAGNECPFEKDGGAFDLTRWNDAYWQRFDRFLQMTHERGIIVQLELWETWDHYGDHEPQGDWSRHPFNPRNNINYTAQEAGLLIGVADDGAIAGIENDRLESDDKFMRHLAQVVRNGLGDRAGTCIDPQTQIVEGKTVCVVSCQRSPEQGDGSGTGGRFPREERTGDRDAASRQREGVLRTRFAAVTSQKDTTDEARATRFSAE